ncbi:MAG: outer membrane beta-barrel protein, partial [Flavipsychrobacter sp.]|nr:outer membrane beta-barrel protein [Flavipsychrobacter sp.]
MDKNFIKVDDLVRQRLSGGEERERSGAWLNMRDLLDKEMPQEERRIGIFYWRRLFSVVAALSLVGTVAVGSYEFSNAFRNRSVAELASPGMEAVNNEPSTTYAANGTENVVRDEQRVAGRVDGGVSGGLSQKPRHTASASSTNNETEAALNSVAGTVGADGTTTGTITIDGNTHRGTDVKRNTTKTYTTKKEAATKGGAIALKNSRGNREGTESTLTAASAKTANTVEKTTASQEVAVAANNAAVDNKVAAGNATSHAEKGNASGNASTTAHKSDQLGAAGKRSNGTAAKAAVNKGTAKTNPVAGNTQNADLKNGHPVLSSGAAGNSLATAGKNDQPGRSDINALATGGRGVTSNNIPAAGIPTPMPAVAATDESGAAHKTPATALSGQSAESSVSKDEAEVAAGDATAVRNDPPLKDARAEANNSQGKKVITKLLVHTRNIKIAENEYALKEDTISMEKVNMDLGLVATQPAPAPASNDMSATVSGKRASKRAMAGRGRSAASSNGGTANTSAGVSGISTTGGAASKAAAGKQGPSQSAGNGIAEEEKELAVSGTSASGSEDGAAKGANQAIVPASHATDMAKEAEVAKTKPAAKQGAGASLVQKMLSAFNDVKQNASRTQFVPGITAGINANFFGPSSFKGFQFGLTGDIIFNEKWNIMTEFKYFHRLNNNTQVDDNFYTYTQVGSQYRKDLQLNSYSFSALHSLELPVSVRYHQGKFDFYAGGNFLYTFSINTGAATQPAVGVAPEFVSTPGNDNAPTLSEADFNSRFGLGYLFGFSYQVAPKFNIDIRNVQTVWDNAASTGAKSISNQLYKTPSLQLSIMYRLGGNRNK